MIKIFLKDKTINYIPEKVDLWVDLIAVAWKLDVMVRRDCLHLLVDSNLLFSNSTSSLLYSENNASVIDNFQRKLCIAMHAIIIFIWALNEYGDIHFKIRKRTFRIPKVYSIKFKDKNKTQATWLKLFTLYSSSLYVVL